MTKFDHTVSALMNITEGFTTVLWGRVVTRGVGLNWRVDGSGRGWVGPVQAHEILRPGVPVE